MDATPDDSTPALSTLTDGSRAVLGRTQSTLANELKALDPSLEGLYLQALRLMPSAGEPGIAYLICHVGRELSRAVLRKLGPDDLDRIELLETPETERNRATIASVLGLPVGNPIVSDWFKLVRFFAENVHYRPSVASGAEVQAAFGQFERLLYMTVAPFFEAKPELDRLLQVAEPTPEDVASLTSVLARRALRVRFFARCSQSGWAKPLLDLGIFNEPPQAALGEGGSLATPFWDAGAFLARVAAQVPSVATTVFTQLTQGNTNPYVWATAVDAAMTLPVDSCTQIAAQLRRALPNSPTVVFGRDLVRLCARLAHVRSPETIRFVEQSLALQSVSQEPPTTAITSSTAQVRARRGTVFRHIDDYQFERFMEDALPVLQQWQPLETLELLVRKLRSVAWLKREGVAEEPGGSRPWCRRIDTLEDGEEPAGRLAQSVYQLAKSIAVDATSAGEVFLRLEPADKKREEILSRIAIRLLADVGRYVPDRVDRLLISDDATDPPFGVAEVAAALRESFQFGSATARRIFRYAIERGPSVDHVAWRWRYPHPNMAPTELDIPLAVQQWQKSRLEWFHDRLPEELRPLASQTGHTPRQPSQREQALMEDGFWVGHEPAQWDADTSPISADQLSQMTADEVWDFVLTWTPPDEPAPDGMPSRRELRRTFIRYVATASDRLQEIVQSAIRRRLSPEELGALSQGLLEALHEKHSIPWDAVLDLAEYAIAGGAASQAPLDWADVVSDVVRAIGKAAAADVIPQTAAARAWALMSPLISMGDRLDRPEPIASIDALLVASDRRVSGVAIETLVQLRLFGIRARGGGLVDTSAASEAEAFETLLQVVSGAGGAVALAAVGRFTNWIVPFAPNWAGDHVAALHDHPELTEPLKSPAWGVFVLTSHFSRKVFDVVRPLFVASAGLLATATDQADEPDERWSFRKAFVDYVTEAMLAGVVTLGAPDRLMEAAFERASVKERGQAYWLIWRQLRAAGEQATAAVQQVLALWDYRLAQLESNDGPNSKREAKTLGWLVLVRDLPAERALPLAARTLRLSGGELPAGEGFWRAVEQFRQADAMGALDVAELAIEAVLKTPWDRLPVDEVSGFLRKCVSSGVSEVSERASRLVHRLGEHGYDELGSLLT